MQERKWVPLEFGTGTAGAKLAVVIL